MFEQSPGFMALLEGPEHIFKLANRSYRRLVGNRTVLERTVRVVFPELSGSGFFELLAAITTLRSQRPAALMLSLGAHAIAVRVDRL